MTPAERESYVPGYFEWATVLAAAAWIGLWTLWPAAGRKGTEPPRARATTVIYARLQTGAERDYLKPIMATAIGTGIAPGGADRKRLLAGSAAILGDGVPAFLDWKPPVETAKQWDAAGVVPVEAARQLSSYKPEWKEEVVLTNRVSSMVMMVTSDGLLKENGFTLPEFPAQTIKQFDKAWQMVVYVEMSDEGKPRHVLVEQGSGDAKIDAAVVRQIHRGRLEKPCAACSGRVTLNYGLQ